METKHTPGPWTTNPVETSNDEVRANARLVAAAPELLEALQRLNKIPTAEEFYNSHDPNFEKLSPEFCFCMMALYARHIKNDALQTAAEEANLIGETAHNNNAPTVIAESAYEADSNGPDYIFTVNKESILNAYPDENIKDMEK